MSNRGREHYPDITPHRALTMLLDLERIMPDLGSKYGGMAPRAIREIREALENKVRRTMRAKARKGAGR